jgi:hypothetical protein
LIRSLTDAAARDEEVVRLDVAVDDPALVRDLQHLKDHIREHEKVALAECEPSTSPALERLALEELHHEVGGPVVLTSFDDVVVEHLDDVRVRDAIGRVPLAEEASSHLRVLRERAVEHLHCGTRPVAMQPGVHRPHSADAQQPLESPLSVEDSPHACACPGVRVVAVEQSGLNQGVGLKHLRGGEREHGEGE